MGLSPSECLRMVAEIAELLPEHVRPLLHKDQVRASRVKNTRIQIRVAGGRNACFGLLAEIRKATAANNYLCRGLPIKLRVEDSPVARERKSYLLRACRALELKLPQATRPRIDWPDKIYGMLDGEPGPLLAKLGSSNTILWQEPARLQIAPGSSNGELDECMESL